MSVVESLAAVTAEVEELIEEKALLINALLPFARAYSALSAGERLQLGTETSLRVSHLRDAAFAIERIAPDLLNGDDEEGAV